MDSQEIVVNKSCQQTSSLWPTGAVCGSGLEHSEHLKEVSRS